MCYGTILLTKTTAARNRVALSYHSVRGLYFLAAVFATTISYRIIYPMTMRLVLTSDVLLFFVVQVGAVSFRITLRALALFLLLK